MQDRINAPQKRRQLSGEGKTVGGAPMNERDEMEEKQEQPEQVQNDKMPVENDDAPKSIQEDKTDSGKKDAGSARNDKTTSQDKIAQEKGKAAHIKAKATHLAASWKKPSRRAIRIGSAVLVVLVVLVALVVFLTRPQDSLLGSWENQTGDSYMTFREDGTVEVTVQVMHVEGTYTLKENNTVYLNIYALENREILDGDFTYAFNDGALILTDVNGQQEVFTKNEQDLNAITPPETPVVDANLVGTWGDEAGKMSYTFREDGTITCVIGGVSMRGVYEARDGNVYATYSVLDQREQEILPYVVEGEQLTINNIELVKQETASSAP